MKNKKFAFIANCYLFTLYMYHDTIKKTKTFKRSKYFGTKNLT